MQEFPYHRRHISGPHGECVPVHIMQKGGAVLTQAVNELTLQGGGELEKLIRIEERSHCGVQTSRKPLKGDSFRSLIIIYGFKLFSQLNVL